MLKYEDLSIASMPVRGRKVANILSWPAALSAKRTAIERKPRWWTH
jgi:hypothetical protein